MDTPSEPHQPLTIAERIRAIRIGETGVVHGVSYWRVDHVHVHVNGQRLDIDEAAAR